MRRKDGGDWEPENSRVGYGEGLVPRDHEIEAPHIGVP
jgi:hypothetical protein